MLRLLTHRHALRVALGALAVGLLIAGLLARGSTPGRRAPALPRRALVGTPVSLADLHGHADVVVFFSPACTPCHQEAPAVERFAPSLDGRGRILAVDADYSGG
jgi:thiol-disulfide isomerase/thioredoxin